MQPSVLDSPSSSKSMLTTPSKMLLVGYPGLLQIEYIPNQIHHLPVYWKVVFLLAFIFDWLIVVDLISLVLFSSLNYKWIQLVIK